MEELNSRENIIYMNETVFDGQTEQGVELDYVLPDYYPDIFKVLKCCLSPKVVSYSVAGDSKLMLDGVVYIKVLYLSEDSSAVHCIEQRYTYSKIVEIGRKSVSLCGTPAVTITPRTDYCNCRAVSSRRVDVRGAVSCKIRVSGNTRAELPNIPDGLEVKSSEIMCCGETLTAEKQFSVREEIETGAPGIDYIVTCDTVPRITDVRIIADKAVVKGTVTVNALYGVHNPEGSGCVDMEKMSAEIPVSQILDINGITDEHLCLPELYAMNCELLPKADSGIISCELLVLCRVRAQLEETAVIPTDAYSTEYETDLTAVQLKIPTEPRIVSQQFTVRTNLTCDSGEVESVWECRSELRDLMCRPKSESELLLTGQICSQAMGKAGGLPCFMEKQEAFEQVIPAANIGSNTVIDHSACVTDTGFSIRPDGTLDVSAQIEFTGSIHSMKTVEAINSVAIHEDKPKEKDGEYALRIFYASGCEDCWSIAKRYNTTVEAILSENELESGDAKVSGMVLIPTI